MRRYLTVTTYAGDIFAFTESDNYAAFLEKEDWEEYVWQYAESPEDAKENHDIRVSEWRDDIEAGRPEKSTY